MSFPQKISGPSAGAFIPLEKRVNEIIDELTKIKNAVGYGGIEWQYTDTNLRIQIRDSGSISGTALPTGNTGDMLYHDGVDWTLLVAPSGSTTGNDWVLRHNGLTPYWEEPESCP